MTALLVPTVEIGGIVDSLAALRAPIEETFTVAGDGMGEALTAMQEISGAFSGLAQTLDADRLSQSIEALGAITGGLAAVSGGGGSDTLQRLDAMAQLLRAPLGRLRKTIGEVEVLAVNARIEAAQVVAANMDFTVFTREMGRLAELAKVALERMGAELSGLLQLTGTAQDGQLSAQREQGADLDRVARHIGASVTQMTARRRDASDIALRIEVASRDIGDRVGAAILALQTGDITRQRVEHVEEALAGVASGPGAETGPICRLQSLQLREAEADFRRDVDRATNELAALTRDAEAVGRLGGGSAPSFLSSLGGDLRRAVELLGHSRAVDQGLQEMLLPVSQRVGEMVAHVETVRSIEADLRIMGLNATLKCGRLGLQGRGLGVIAQTLRGHAGRTAEDARQVMDGLSEIASMASALTAGQTSVDDGLVAMLREAAEVFDQVDRGFAEAHDTLTRQSARASERLRAEADRFLAATAMTIGFARCGERLSRLADVLGAPKELDGVLAAFPHLQQTYTMASQRDVHARFTGGQGSTPMAAQTVDDMFF